MTTQLPAETPVVLTGAQVAEIFQVHRRTVDRWARAGKLRSVGVGHRRYLRADIEKMLNARGKATQSPACPSCRGAGDCVECDPETAWK